MKISSRKLLSLPCLLALLMAGAARCAAQDALPPDLEDSPQAQPAPKKPQAPKKARPARQPAVIAGTGVIFEFKDISFAEKILYGHYSMVNAALFSRDGKTLFTGGDDSAVHVRDAETGTDLSTLSGHTGWVTAIALSPDGKTLATASNDRTITLWDWQTAAARKKLAGPSGKINDVAFSPDGRWIAGASADRTLTLWETDKWTFVNTVTAHDGWVMKAAFSPDSKLLATAGADGAVRVWNTVDFGSTTIRAGGGTIHSVLFTPDGKYLLFPNAANEIELVSTATWTPEMLIGGHNETIACMAVSPDGKYVASGDEEGVILVRRLEDGSLARRISTAPQIPLALNFSPDGKYLVSARDGAETRVLYADNPLEALVYGAAATLARRPEETDAQYAARARALREKSARLRIQEETRHLRYAAQFRKELVYFRAPAVLGRYRPAESVFELKAAGAKMRAYVPFRKADALPHHRNSLAVEGLLRNRGGNRWELVNACLEDETNSDRFKIRNTNGR